MVKKIFATVVALAVLVAALVFFLNNETSVSYQKSGVQNKDGLYVNSKYKFSAVIPEGYSVREIKSDESDSIVMENTAGDGIQVMISPYSDIEVLTEQMVKQSIPDLEMKQVQIIEVGEKYKGIAFLSNNPDFGGASRDVWFVFRGHLYQISTYERLDAVLKSMFSTWQFE